MRMDKMVLLAVLAIFGLYFLIGGTLTFIASGALLGIVFLLGAAYYFYKGGMKLPTRIFPMALLAVLAISGIYFLLGGGLAAIGSGVLLGVLLLAGAGYVYLRM